MRRMGFLGGSLIRRGGVLRGVGGGRGVGVGLLFEEGGFFEGVVWIVFLNAASDFLFWVVVEMLLNCDNSSIIVVGRFCLFSFCRRHRLSFYVIVPCHFTA